MTEFDGGAAGHLARMEMVTRLASPRDPDPDLVELLLAAILLIGMDATSQLLTGLVAVAIDAVVSAEMVKTCFRCSGPGYPAEQEEHHKKSYGIGKGDRPPVANPEADGLRLRIHIRQGNPGRRAEPNHRSAETDRIGQEGPVISSLLKGKARKRDIVKGGRYKTQSESRVPAGRRELPPPASWRHL